MSKLGWEQDLVRGIQKLHPLNVSPAPASAPAANTATTDTLLKRAFMFLEDGEWAKADEKCESVLDIDPENPLAYLGKLMIDLRVTVREQLGQARVSFEENKNYVKIIRFGSPALKAEVQEYLEAAKARAVPEPAPVSAPSTGDYSVYVSARGTSPLSLIKVVREITGFGLKDAKDMVDGFPSYFAKDLSYDQAEIIKQKLASAGATVEIRGSSMAAAPTGGSYSVNLYDCGTSKLMAIKIVREATGYGLKDAKELVERLPAFVKSDITYEEAARLKQQFDDIGATAQII